MIFINDRLICSLCSVFVRNTCFTYLLIFYLAPQFCLGSISEKFEYVKIE